MKVIRNAAVAATGCVCLSSVPLVAQSQSAPDTAASADSSALAEIIVTAEHRSENLQNVPVAVTALSADYLAANNI